MRPVPAHLIVRRATPHDVPDLVALMSSFYAEADLPLAAEAATGAFDRFLARPELGCVLLADNGGRPLGHLVLTFSWSMEYGGLRAFVDDLFVRPDCRSQGVGRALLAAAEEAAREAGAGAILVEVGAENEAGRRAYHAAGYVDTSHMLLSRTLGTPLHLQ